MAGLNAVIEKKTDLINSETGYPMLSNEDIQNIKDREKYIKDNIKENKHELSKIPAKAAKFYGSFGDFSGEVNKRIFYIVSAEVEQKGLYYFAQGDWKNAEKEWLKVVYHSELALLGLNKIYSYQQRYKDKMRVLRTYYYYARDLNWDKSKIESIEAQRDQAKVFAKEHKSADKSIFKNYDQFDSSSKEIDDQVANLQKNLEIERETVVDLKCFDRDIRHGKSAGFTKIVWHTMDDKRVCDACRAKENKVFSMVDAPELRKFKKKHKACRCIISFY